MKFEKIAAGMILYDVHSYTMGRTPLRSVGVWLVEVIEVDPATRSAMVRWNHNAAHRVWEHTLKKYRAKKPELVTGFMGQQKLAPRKRKSAESPLT